MTSLMPALDLYNYRGKITRVIDGDTLELNIDLGLNVQLQKQILRLKGINAPEMRGESRESAIASRNYLSSLVLDKDVIIATYKSRNKDKYGRYLAEVWLLDRGDRSVNQMLVDGGFAVKYEC